MTDDHVAIVEAWTRRKPRRIIQNQLLIELILAFALPCAMIGIMIVLWMISIYPLTMTALFGGWIVTSSSYLALCVVRKKMR